MTKPPKRDAWLAEARDRQRNIVFPDTVRNEGHFWRNLANRRLNFVQQIGFAVVSLFVFWSFAFVVFTSVRMSFSEPGSSWHKIMSPLGYWLSVLLLAALVFGPIFALVIWGTRRSLREKGHHAARHR
jgi:hypothetical protein